MFGSKIRYWIKKLIETCQRTQKWLKKKWQLHCQTSIQRRKDNIKGTKHHILTHSTKTELQKVSFGLINMYGVRFVPERITIQVVNNSVSAFNFKSHLCLYGTF